LSCPALPAAPGSAFSSAYSLSILHTTTLLVAMAWGVGWGVIFGGVFAAVGYAMTGGRRDFSSLSVTVPSRFHVLVLAGHGAHARTLLTGTSLIPERTGLPPPDGGRWPLPVGGGHADSERVG
jgi:hypothetical protein